MNLHHSSHSHLFLVIWEYNLVSCKAENDMSSHGLCQSIFIGGAELKRDNLHICLFPLVLPAICCTMLSVFDDFFAFVWVTRYNNGTMYTIL